jgi:DNA-directed RNA polymerase subunit omega
VVAAAVKAVGSSSSDRNVVFCKEFVMARLTVEDCLAKEGNHFALVLLAATRAKQLLHGGSPLVVSHNRASVVALREIAAGRVRFNESVKEVLVAFIAERKAAGADAPARSHSRTAALRSEKPS